MVRGGERENQTKPNIWVSYILACKGDHVNINTLCHETCNIKEVIDVPLIMLKPK